MEEKTDGSSVDEDVERMMVIDFGVSMSLVSSVWLEDYLKDMEVDERDVERRRDDQSFELGKTTYTSTEKVKFLLRMRTDQGGLMEMEITANIIDSVEITFLCGKRTLVDW